jgi:hypothetical protein
VSSPPRPFSIFLSPVLSLVRPRRRLSPAPTAYCRRPARADGCQGWPLFSGHTLRGLWPLQQSSTTAGLMGRVDYAPLSILSRLRISARYSDGGCFCAIVHASSTLASRIGAAGYKLMRLSHAPGGMGLIFRTADWHFANLRCGPTATHPTRPTHPTGLSELSALSTVIA